METWVVIFDSISTISFLIALILVIQISKDRMEGTSKLFLGLGAILYILVGISNLLEHMNITSFFDRYEDYLEILFIPFFLFFLFSLYMEQQLREREKVQEALFQEKERAQVTLASIGDAVITTDQYGHVEYLNPVAEELTGWPITEALQKPLGTVFQIINEQTRKPAPDPVERCLKEGKAIGLANHTVLIRRDGKEFSIDDSAAPIRSRDGQIIGVVLVFHDVTEARRLQRQMTYDAAHDTLTGLVNRREFEVRLERCLKSAQQNNLEHSLCYIDLDQFKVVNDTAGHIAGDELLRQVSRLLSSMFRHRDTLARLGGDEFGLLLENCPLDKAIEAANKIIDRLAGYQFPWEGQSFRVGASIGVVSITGKTHNIAQALSEADVACYTAKDLGRSRFHVYQAEDSETAQRHGEILQAVQLRDAIDKDLFQLYCQPFISLLEDNSQIKYYELLLRLKGDGNKVILPNTFIPSAERYGLMTSIDRWVVRTALSAFANRLKNGDIRLSINLSGNSLNDETLLDFVRTQFNKFSIPPEWICFEITETAAIQNLSKAQYFVSEVRRLGAKVALDDFGSGLSSFRYLKTLAVDFLKIDGSFVKDMLESQNDKAIVAAIHQVGHTMGIYTIAEHVEHEDVITQLQEMGVDYAQGYAIGQPIPFESILE